ERARDGTSAPRRGLPVHVLEAVAGGVLAQFFKLAAFSHLPEDVHPKLSTLQILRRTLPRCRQVRIHPDLEGRGSAPCDAPQPRRRPRFQRAHRNPVAAPSFRCEWPLDARMLAAV